MRKYHLPSSLPPALPPDLSAREQRWFEIREQVTAFEDRDRAIVHSFRRSKRLVLDGQVKLDV